MALNIEGTDRVGLVNDITRIISSQMKVNIKSISIGVENSIFRGSIDLIVHDASEVSKMIKELEIIEGVVKITRHNHYQQ